jgi:hypothetical protein
MSFTENVMRVGDEVIFNRGEDYYAQKGDPVKDRTKGVIVGKNRVLHYSPRIGSYSARKPGIYEIDRGAIVEWEDGTTSSPNMWKVSMTDKAEYNRRLSDARAERNTEGHDVVDDRLENRTFIADLPVTRAWERDFIKFTFRGRSEFEYGIVQSIEYDDVSSDRITTYRVQCVNKYRQVEGGTTYVRENMLEVVERGNVYRYFNGEPTFFLSLKDEAQFFIDLGHLQSIPFQQERSVTYSWDVDDAVAALETGEVDLLVGDDGPFAYGRMRINVYKFNDRVLGERMRQASLRMFGCLDKDSLA